MTTDYEPRVGKFEQPTDIALDYGEQTWRPLQSIIDILQNPLDANSTVFEKRLLGAVGIVDYQPSDKTQLQIVGALEHFKYSSVKDRQSSYSSLRQTIGVDLTDCEQLYDQLSEINFHLPIVKVKVTDGSSTQFVDYNQIAALPIEWQITGFRVYDSGAGFDYRLLGMMGVSTKKDSLGKRGGLGEGLKMSIRQLYTEGARVRILSRNQDQLWIARPTDEDGKIVFKGRARFTSRPSVTGSITDVNFSDPKMDTNAKAELTAALDPRLGGGLGELILDFRGSEFFQIINTTAEVCSMGVVAGRVYVKGLLVENPSDILLSYNLENKWAIGGRDRKKVKRDILLKAIRESLQQLQNPAQIYKIISAVRQSYDFLEFKTLDKSLILNETQKQLWRQAVIDNFNFRLGPDIFIPSNLSVTDLMELEQKGFHPISLPINHFAVVSFFETLFNPSQIISWYQYEAIRGRIKPKNKDIAVAAQQPIEDSENSFSKEVLEALNNLKKEFIDFLLQNQSERMRRGDLIKTIDYEQLLAVRFATASANEISKALDANSVFDYDAHTNVMYVKDADFIANFSSKLDFFVQMIKAAVKSNVFNVSAQLIAEQLAADAIVSLKPETRQQLGLEASNGIIKFTLSESYLKEKQDQDRRAVEYFMAIRNLATSNLSKEQLETELKNLRLVKANIPLFEDSKGNFWGKLFTNDIGMLTILDGNLYGLDLDELILRAASLANRPGIPVLGLGDMLSTFTIIPAIDKLITGAQKNLKGNQISTENLDNVEIKIARPSAKFEFIATEVLPADVGEFSIKPGNLCYLPFTLNEGDRMVVSFIQGDKTIDVSIRRQGSKISTTIISDRKVKLAPLEKYTFFDDKSSTGIRVYNNVLLINSKDNFEVIVRKGNQQFRKQLPELSYGKDFLPTNISIDFGGDVWRDPKRILLDALQNHLDAANGCMPTLNFTIMDERNNVKNVTEDQLRTHDNNWRIVGVTIEDDGEGYTTPFLTTLGSSTKTDDDLGRFGEGLKLLAAAAVREGIDVQFRSREWTATPTGYNSTITDYEIGKRQSYTMLGFRLQWADQARAGSQTNFSLSNSTSSTWQQWVEVLDPRKVDDFGNFGLGRFVVAPDEIRVTDGVVEVISSRPGQVFEKGLKINGGSDKPMLFGYSINENIIDTRERNSYDQELFDAHLAEFFRNLTDKQLMKKILQAASSNPQNYYEYKFLDPEKYPPSMLTRILWRQSFYEIFGNNAILSLRTILDHQNSEIIKSWTNETKSISDYSFLTFNDKYGVREAVANEAHLEGYNLQLLQWQLSSLLAKEVYSSKNFVDDLSSAEVELPPDDKEKLFYFIQRFNLLWEELFELIDANSETKELLAGIVKNVDFHERRAEIANIGNENIKIKHSTFPVGGLVTENNGQPVIYLNENLLGRVNRLMEIYTHEASHYLSGRNDYDINFMRFLMLVALQRV